MSPTAQAVRPPSTSSVASDDPVPRGSNQIVRLNEERAVTKCANAGSSHMRSIGKSVGLYTRIVAGPSPTT